MKNSISFLMRSKVKLNVKGNNIIRFIKRLKTNSIEIINIEYLSSYEANIIIYKNDYDSVLKLKAIYEINKLEFYGFIKLKNKILSNKYIIVFILISLIFLYVITNMIFEIDVITNNSNFEKVLLEELEDLGIKKYRMKKDYNILQKIKHTILLNHKDELEWIEIESVGTKYIIRYEPRIKNNNEEVKTYRNIIAKKDSIIKKMNISNGQIIKGLNSYVKKGDIIVSGYISLNDSIKDTVFSEGKVYGEVWYKVSITYPYKYKEIKETGNKNKVLVIKILNKDMELFNFNKYKTKKVEDNTLIKNSLLPIKFVIQKQRETIIIDEDNSEDTVIEKAIILSKEKINETLDKDEYISDYKILNMMRNNDSITLNIFFTVVENIGEYQPIPKYENILN